MQTFLILVNIVFWVVGLCSPTGSRWRSHWLTGAPFVFSLSLIAQDAWFDPDPRREVDGTIAIVIIWALGCLGMVTTRWHAKPGNDEPEADTRAEAGVDPAVIDGPGFDRRGLLTFEYVDDQGRTSVRTVSDWTDDPTFIYGWCFDERAVTVFRKKQVSKPLEGFVLFQPPEQRSAAPSRVEEAACLN